MPTKLYLLDGGNFTTDRSICTYNIGRGQKHVSQVYTAYIEHPEVKIVVDTGMDISVLPEERVKAWSPQQLDSQRIDNALRALGVKPEDIDIVINTHLHADHCSFNKLFTNATWLIQRDEFLQALTPEPFEPTYIRSTIQGTGPKPEFLNGDYNVVNGVQIISTPGHTEGHQSVTVETEKSGVFFITGDMCMVRENFEGSERTSREGWPPGAHNDLRQGMRSLRKLKKIMAETKAKKLKTCMPLYSHDSEEFAKWKHSPEHYE